MDEATVWKIPLGTDDGRSISQNKAALNNFVGNSYYFFAFCVNGVNAIWTWTFSWTCTWQEEFKGTLIANKYPSQRKPNTQAGNIDPFHATSFFLYLTENLWSSDVCSGYRKTPVAWNGLNTHEYDIDSQWPIKKTYNPY